MKGTEKLLVLRYMKIGGIQMSINGFGLTQSERGVCPSTTRPHTPHMHEPHAHPAWAWYQRKVVLCHGI